MSVRDKRPWQRVLSMLLCLVMLLSFVPATAFAVEEQGTEPEKMEILGTEEETAADAAGSGEASRTESDAGISAQAEELEYVSLPVIIRDFAADGMLFEFAQPGVTSTQYATYRTYDYIAKSATSSSFEWSTNSHLGFRVRPYSVFGTKLPAANEYWYCIICESNGDIVKILPSGPNTKEGIYESYMKSGRYSVWLWIADKDSTEHTEQRAVYEALVELVNEKTQHNYRITYNNSGKLSIQARYGERNGKKFFLGDNNGFTLLNTDTVQYVNDLLDSDDIPGTQLIRNQGASSDIEPDPVTVTLNSTARQQVYGANIRTNLVAAELDEDGKPVYTEATVDYLAGLLYTMLRVPYSVKVGNETYYTAYYLLGTKLYNSSYEYVGKHSDEAVCDLADVLRAHIVDGMGTYADAKAEFEAGRLTVPQDVDTYYEAAYYLLHYVWRDSEEEGYTGEDGYGWNTWNYNKINLVQTINEAGQKCYVFNSGYDDTAYDYMMKDADGHTTGSGAIYNTQVEHMTPAKNKPVDSNGNYIGTDVYSSGVILPNDRFDPLGTSGAGASFGYGQNAGTYCELLGSYPARGELFYPTTNYHLSLEGHAKFIYYKDAAQYFTFTGDDDVYLYINGIRVLDLGGAHSIAKVRINMNDIAALCGLKDGNTYTFDFFYMERHGTAANFGIETNIQIVDPSMLTTKTGYQNGESTGYNGFVDPEQPVTYEFALENNGDADIENLTFTDATIGVELTADKIVLNELTDIGDLSVTLYDPEGYAFTDDALTEESLKGYLAEGIVKGGKIVIHGFNYLIQDDDWDCRFVDENGNHVFDEGEDRTSNWYFFNIIYTTAIAVDSDNLSTRELTGTSNWVVQREGDGGPVTDKTVAATDDPNEFELTLEAYALGQTQTTVVEKTNPSDIVLVLDQSASMYAPADSKDDYDNSALVDGLSSSVAVEALDRDKAAHMGYYVAQSKDGRGHSDEDRVFDWFVVQYIDGKWYYVRKDKTAMPAKLDVDNANPGSANVLGETLVRDEPIESFNYYQSGYGALYDSVCEFVDGIKASGVDHRIAVVGFASPCYDGIEFFDGSGIYLDGKYYLYDAEYLEDEKGVYTYIKGDPVTRRYLNAEQIAALKRDDAKDVWDKALVSVTDGYDSIMNSVNAVTTNYWNTCTAAGLDMANQIFANTSNLNADGTERDRIVILFTDGVPTTRIGADYGESANWKDKDENGLYMAHVYWTVAQGKDNALEMAYLTKNTYGAKIHAVGTSAVEDQLFLSGVSSDYPDAREYPTYYTDSEGVNHSYEDHMAPPPEETVRTMLGSSIPGSKYTHVTSDTVDLSDIFEKILESTTEVKVAADEHSVLREVLTDYFVLRNNSEIDVDVYTAVYNGDGTYAPAELRTDLEVALVSSEGTDRLDTIDVSGFDYRDEYISSVVRNKDGKPYYGSKLILKVRIRTRDGFWGGNNVPTNESITGIYNGNGELMSRFPEPQVNVPLSLTINARDAVVYYGSDDLHDGLVDSITAGGMSVIIGENGSLLPLSDWMNDYAELNWTEGMTSSGDDLSSTADGSYTYGVTLTPIHDGQENNSKNPGNMAGAPVELSGMSKDATGKVEILVPVVYFQDSTLQQGEKPDTDYFMDHNLVEGISWVLMTNPGSTKAATQGSAPALNFTYHHMGVFTEATPVNVTVKGIYGTNEHVEMTEVSYFDWKSCTNTDLHDEGTIQRHLGGTAGQNEFWIHVPEGVTVDSLVTDKYVEATQDPNKFVLTLEAYSMGRQDTFTKPADIVLVLDHSGSMRTPVGAPEVLESGTRYTGGGEIPRSQIIVEKAKHRGYYVAQSTATNSWFVMEYDEDFPLNDGTTAERWVGYLVPTTESIVDTTPGNYTEHTMTLSWVPGSVDANLVFYKSQYAVLYDALLEFVEDLKDSGAEHNVSIVGFAGSETWGTRLYVGGDETAYKYYQDHLYHDNTTQARREELYRKSMKNVQDPAEYAELISNINVIETNHSFTCPTAGLQLANEVFDANAVSMADRDRIVVLFTDGIPNRQMGENEGITVDDAKQKAIYDEIVKKANETKNTYGAQVYSICTTTVTGSRDFLNFSSSNYPDAAGYTAPGAAADSRYYHEIKDFETLSNVFKTVTQSAASVTLDETAILREVLTDYFVLDPDADVKVEVYTASYNGDGTFAEPVQAQLAEKKGEGFYVELDSSDGVRDDIISVTGFDYRDEYISNVARTVDGKPYYGSKLVVKVYIDTRDGFWGGNNVPTNEDSTAIYGPDTEDGNGNKIPGKPVAGFPEPEVNVPADVEVVAKDKTIYYGGDITAEDLLERVTAGGIDVIIDGDQLKPQQDWMDDYADLSWTADSAKPSTTPDNTTPGDYTFEVQLKPNAPATDNKNDPGNIAGAPVDPEGTTASDTGHVYILVPELTFEDSVTDLFTPTEGYDYDNKDFVSTETKWVNMETDLPEGTVVPPVSGTAPELELTYTPEGDVTEFVGDTKVDVTVSIGGADITDLVGFHWKDCVHNEHGTCGTINSHKGGAGVHEFWVHTTISILPDTVVIDFGLPVRIDPLTNDLYNAEGVAKSLKGIGDDFAESYTGTFGSAEILEGNQLVQYAQNISNGMQMNREETFRYQGAYTIKDHTYTAESDITVIPATIIYYEDSFVEFSSYTRSDSVWNQDETSAWKAESGHTEIQATDRPGADQIGMDMDNLYGYDGAYADESHWSMDSFHQITVDADHKGEASFTFTGTAFDVIALSSGTTGTITVKIYEGTTTDNLLKSYMVDTYYGYQYTDADGDGDKEWNPTDPKNPNALYQVPVMKVDMSQAEKPQASGSTAPVEYYGYGTYHVVISVAYNSFFDHGQNNNGGGSYEFMLDAIRIYDQANDGAGNETIENAYVADGEGWPSYIELRDILIAANTFDSLGEEDAVNGIVFIDGIPALTDDSASGEDGGIFTDPADGRKTAIADYANFGPNNELYLAKGQGVSFALELDGQNVEHIHLALKSVGGTAKVTVYGVDDRGNKTYALGSAAAAAEIATATDLYYDITALRDSKAIVIVSSGDAIASITNIKMTHSKSVPTQSEQTMMLQRFRVSRDTAALALAAVAPAPVNPFVDVAQGDFYYDSVLWAVRNGITGGVDDTHFAPGQASNRAQVVTFLWRAAGCPEPNAAMHPFVDVEEGAFYYKAMLWAVEKGITSGVDDTHFDPSGECNRAQIVTFLWRAAGSPEPNVSGHPFADVQAGSFYEKATMWAVEHSITKGVAPDSFGPAITCTRGQVVTFLYRASVR